MTSPPIIAPLMMAQKQALNAPAPLGVDVAMPGSTPSLGSPSLPLVTRPPTQTETDQTHRNQLINSGDGISQIHNPLLRGIARAADIAGSVFAPNLAMAIPGTMLHHNYLVNQATRNVVADQAQDQAGANISDSQAQVQQRQALAQQEQANLANLPTVEADRHAQSQAATRKENDQAGAIENSPDKAPVLAQLHANAVNKAIQEGRDPSQDPTVNHLADAITSLQKQPQQRPGTKTVQLQINGRPHQVLIDEATGKTIQDLGESGEKPPTVNVNAGVSALDRESKQFGAPHQKSLDASNAQLEKIADARAMINGNAEAQGLGIPKVLTALVGGQGTGVRITQAELESIAHARGISGDVEGTINKWSGKGALSQQQQKQLTQIMDDVKARLLQKQAIASDTLDTINGATTREQIIAADKAARKRLSDLETGGNGGGGKVSVTAPDGSVHPFDTQAQADAFKKIAGIK
jgi:hypothetical protein